MAHLLTAFMLATLTFTPSIEFTADSKYVNENIISYEVVVEDDESKTLLLKQNMLLGYCIYDNPDTDKIEGLKVDDTWVDSSWRITNFDDTVEHSIKIKTVYTDDYAGMAMAAKNGDWGKVLENPLALIQLFYYVIAAVSIVIGGCGAARSKKHKVKSANEIAALVNENSQKAYAALEQKVELTIDSIIKPIYAAIQKGNQNTVSALILNKQNSADASVALIDMLKQVSAEDIVAKADEIKKAIIDNKKASTEVLENAKETVNNIAKGVFEEPASDKYDGTSI